MPKEFYTERDIEDMVRRGILSLEINDNVVLTDLAYEKANRLGMRLVRDKPDNPPGAPVRPYLSQAQPKPAASAGRAPAASPPAPTGGLSSAGSTNSAGGVVPPPQMDGAELRQRIRSAVVARLGSQVDSNLLDAIITRVLQSTGIK
ncbi:MAG: hypothetical protein EHM21_10380 [Chloroflexi bacterium]|nr:MAG: hypothetical protein EHM21_10380 [Chloroflexota bacterium]